MSRRIFISYRHNTLSNHFFFYQFLHTQYFETACKWKKQKIG